MPISIEPCDGHPLERMITALLNATGVVKQAIDGTPHPPNADGVTVIGMVAERLRRGLGLLAEHRRDEELDLVAEVLAEATLLAAADLDLDLNIFHD